MVQNQAGEPQHFDEVHPHCRRTIPERNRAVHVNKRRDSRQPVYGTDISCSGVTIRDSFRAPAQRGASLHGSIFERVAYHII